MQKRVKTFVGFDPYIAANAAVAAGRTASRHEFLAAKCSYPVSAVASFDMDLCSIDEHN